MSHELTIRANSTAEMAYVGEQPWHGLGQQLTEGASIEEWIKAAGMDWTVKRSKVRYFTDMQGSQAGQFEMPDQHVLFRDDTKAALGIVSPSYKTVQPRAVLEFFRDLVDGAGYKLHTAGTMFGGKKFWALAKVAEACVQGKDLVGSYLLLHTSCDGSSATACKETTIRVVCNNTLSAAASERGGIKVSHRQRFDADAIKARMALTENNFHAFMEIARQLSAKRITKAAAEAFVRNLLRPAVEGVIPDEDMRAPRGEAAILGLFHNSAMGGTLLGANGTAWGLVNAVTEYVDHKASAKSVDHRLNSAWFGDGDALKNRAFDLALAI